MMNLIQEIKHDETGSELVETALSIPILFAVIFGIIYFSFALYADHFVANVAKEAARLRSSSWFHLEWRFMPVFLHLRLHCHWFRHHKLRNRTNASRPLLHQTFRFGIVAGHDQHRRHLRHAEREQ